MKKLGNPFKGMKLHEYLLLSISIIAIIVSFILIDQKDYLTLFTAIVGMFMAVFIAKANFWGQIFSVFNVGLYAATAYLSRYYGELIIRKIGWTTFEEYTYENGLLTRIRNRQGVVTKLSYDNNLIVIQHQLFLVLISPSVVKIYHKN